ncbi:MAG: DNA-processing protein DprA [Peptococcaceae bacterium]|nr:DNA-processing protein DprA [Peptococcaceae bacterium]
MTNNVSEYVYWAALHKIWETMHNSGRIMRQLQTVTTGEVLWKASALQLAEAFPTLPAEYCQSLIAARRQYDLHKIEAYLTEHHIHMVLHNDPAYPAFLKEIHQPPAILYYKGNFIEEPLQIAMVGSRKADRYGLDVAERIASQFSMANVPVVSGLAKGVDAAAHKGAILYQGGTIAVQGCGIDRVYPRENKTLAEEILAHPKGCIVTEFPIGSEPAAWHFPMRNRIISGLANGVVIVQAARKSGAYITVETALEQGRDVFAIPGQIYNPLSEGPHQLLQEGAQLITCADDVLRSYGLIADTKKKEKKTNKTAQAEKEQQMSLFDAKPLSTVTLSDTEARVLELFTAEPLAIEEAAYLSRLSMAELMPVLSMLELYGLIEPMVGRKYIRIG